MGAGASLLTANDIREAEFEALQPQHIRRGNRDFLSNVSLSVTNPKDIIFQYLIAKYGLGQLDSSKQEVLDSAWEAYFDVLDNSEELEFVAAASANPKRLPDKKAIVTRLVIAYVRAYKEEISEDNFIRIHFDLFDKDKNGIVTASEGLVEAVKSIGLAGTDDILVTKFIIDSSRGVNFKTFQAFVKKMDGMKKFIDNASDLKVIFDTLDINHDGKLTVGEISINNVDKTDEYAIAERLRDGRFIPEGAPFDEMDLARLLSEALNATRMNTTSNTLAIGSFGVLLEKMNKHLAEQAAARDAADEEVQPVIVAVGVLPMTMATGSMIGGSKMAATGTMGIACPTAGLADPHFVVADPI